MTALLPNQTLQLDLMMGHLTVEAHDEGGDLIAYRQTDNEVVDDGEQCILKMLFATTDGEAGTAGRGSTNWCIYHWYNSMYRRTNWCLGQPLPNCNQYRTVLDNWRIRSIQQYNTTMVHMLARQVTDQQRFNRTFTVGN